MTKPAQNSGDTAKKVRGKPFAKGKGKDRDARINAGGRPKDGCTMADALRWAREQYAQDLIDVVGKNNPMYRDIIQYPPNVQVKYLAAIRAWTQFLFDPTAPMLKEITDRVDGKVKDTLSVEMLSVEALQEAMSKVYGADSSNKS